MAYNGHQSWLYWNVALWLANDERLYTGALSALRRHNGNRREAAKDMLADLHACGITATADGATYSQRNISAAMEGFV
jgi:hypothetical protein